LLIFPSKDFIRTTGVIVLNFCQHSLISVGILVSDHRTLCL